MRPICTVLLLLTAACGPSFTASGPIEDLLLLDASKDTMPPDGGLESGSALDASLEAAQAPLCCFWAGPLCPDGGYVSVCSANQSPSEGTDWTECAGDGCSWGIAGYSAGAPGVVGACRGNWADAGTGKVCL